MNLNEAVDPIFLYVCKLNRIANSGGEMSFNAVRSDVITLLNEARAKASRNKALSDKFASISRPLLMFIDFMSVDSGINFALEWNENPLLNEFNASGGTDFRECAKSALKHETDEDILRFYFTCIGLGCGDKDNELLELSHALKNKAKIYAAKDGRITQAAYDNVDASNFVKPVKAKLWMICSVFIIFMVSVVASLAFMYRESSAGIVNAVEKINARGQTK